VRPTDRSNRYWVTLQISGSQQRGHRGVWGSILGTFDQDGKTSLSHTRSPPLPFVRHRLRSRTRTQTGGQQRLRLAVPKAAAVRALPASGRPALLEHTFNVTEPFLGALQLNRRHGTSLP